jgi:UDP-N-acetylglucosamine:LPS N-acetylglucosamine transferase
MNNTDKTILLLAANTGNGHIAGMDAVFSHLVGSNLQIKRFPFFYEEIVSSNQQMSDFYNLLLQTSFELCKQFTRLALLESSQKNNYDYVKYWKGPLNKFFENNPCDVIVSFAPIINKYLIEFLKDYNTHIKFYIVVLDPFKPVYPGFDSIGADLYFVSNNIVKEYLFGKGIASEKIIVSGFPLDYHISDINMIKREKIINFEGEKINLSQNSRTILIACGAQGAIHFVKIIETILNYFNHVFNIIVVCGHNNVLYNIIKNQYKGIYCFKYVNSLDFLGFIASADICITKAGANTFHQCLYLNTVMLIDGIKGFLYQEEGVTEFLEEYPIGDVFYSLEELYNIILSIIDNNFSKLVEWQKCLKKINIKNGGNAIAKIIMKNY